MSKIALRLCSIWAIGVSALGVTASISAGPEVGLGIDQGPGVIVQFEDRINLSPGDDGVAGDYLFRKGNFKQKLPASWFIGADAFTGRDPGLGVRLPLGVDMKFDQRLEGYVQLAPAIDVDDDHRDGSGHRDHTAVGVDAALGVRYAL